MQTHLLVGNLPQRALLHALLLLLLLLGALHMLRDVAHLLLNQQAQHATTVKSCCSSHTSVQSFYVASSSTSTTLAWKSSCLFICWTLRVACWQINCQQLPHFVRHKAARECAISQ